MEIKDIKNMTNAELRLYQKSLENEYETIKAKISEHFKTLDKLDVIYNNVEHELNNRKNMKL